MNKKLKKELGDRLKYTKALYKELRGIPKESIRAIAIRKELGISTLKDLIDRYPIRICKHCSKKAYALEDLWDFVYNKSHKYNHTNCCVDCNTLLRQSPGIQIVGLHQPITFSKSCEVCKKVDNGIGERSWFLPRATVCKECLGTHESMFGSPMAIKHPQIVYQWKGKEYTSITSLAKAMGLSYSTVRLLILQNKLKDYNGIIR